MPEVQSFTVSRHISSYSQLICVMLSLPCVNVAAIPSLHATMLWSAICLLGSPAFETSIHDVLATNKWLHSLHSFIFACADSLVCAYYFVPWCVRSSCFPTLLYSPLSQGSCSHISSIMSFSMCSTLRSLAPSICCTWRCIKSLPHRASFIEVSPLPSKKPYKSTCLPPLLPPLSWATSRAMPCNDMLHKDYHSSPQLLVIPLLISMHLHFAPCHSARAMGFTIPFNSNPSHNEHSSML